MKVEKLSAVNVTTEHGVEYVRFSPISWFQTFGDTLEQVQFPEDLEGRYQAHLHTQRLTRKRQCVNANV